MSRSPNPSSFEQGPQGALPRVTEVRSGASLRSAWLGIGLLLATAACEKQAAPSASPEEAAEVSAPEADMAQTTDESNELGASGQAPPGLPPAFSFVVVNQCPDKWHATVLPNQAHIGYTPNAEVSLAVNEEQRLSMRVGDILVLKSSAGGATATDFDSWERGEGAKLVVVDDCTGVHTTYGRGRPR